MVNGQEKDYQPIPIDKIDMDKDVGKWNVRTLERDKKIEDLAESISKYGLLQPIVVFQEGDKYHLIIGQRRARVFKELYKKDPKKYEKITARVLPRKPDEEEAKILSLSENIHRVELNRQNIVETIEFLYERYKSVEKVAKLLGIHPVTVSGYIPIVKAPSEIRQKYYNKQITKEDVRRLMLIAPDDKNKMIEIAKGMPKLTKDQKERLVDAGIRMPQAQPKKLLEEAQRPHMKGEVVVPLNPELSRALESAVKDINLSREEIARNALVEWLSEKGYYKE